ncbi:MAG: ATP-binding protein [Candidatus Nealsonbacteria bacterium]
MSLIESLIYLISIFCNFLLASFVLLKSRREKVNKTFFLSVISANAWLISLFLYYSFENPEWVLWLGRINFAMVLPILYYLLKFAVVFPTESIFKFNKITKYLIPLFLILFILTIFTPLVAKEEIITGLGQRETIYGQLYGFYIINYFLVSFFVGLILFLKLKKYEKTTEKLQIRYVLVGLIISLIFGFITNIILPYLGFFNMANYGPLATIIFSIFVTVAIAKHHLFEIKVVLVELFVVVIALILFIQAWINESAWLRVLNWSVFTLFCIFGYYLIRATIEEIRRREQIERISKDLEKAYRELKKLDIAKSEFISIASHQLRTPLTAIKGYISLITDKTYGIFPSKMEKPLTNIYASVERLIKLVNDLLSISRIEAGKIKVEPEEFLLEELITDILEELRNLAKAKNLYIRLEKQEEPCNKVFLDVAKIRQVILNIVDNGIKYTQAGGITITYGQDKDLCKIEIKDTGAGMTKSEISMLFKTFSRGVAGQKTWTEGAGLGLYIAKQFTEMHNGKIWVKSAGNKKGSTFYIELPIKYEEKI